VSSLEPAAFSPRMEGEHRGCDAIPLNPLPPLKRQEDRPARAAETCQ
jgi:hypothetical protein